MRIVIDMQGAQTESRFRGIGRYTMSFVQAMVRNRGEHEIILALSGLFPDTIEPIRAAFDGLLPYENIRVWNAVAPVASIDSINGWRRQSGELVRESFVASLQPDAVLVSSLFEGLVDDAVTSIGQLPRNFLTAAILYDLIPYIHRKLYFENRAFEAWYLKKIEYLRRADLWLAISESSRLEGINYLGLPAERSVNISTDADAHFQPIKISAETEQALRQKYGLRRHFVMYTGGIEHRKNIEGLIRAFARLPRSLRGAHQLAIVCSVQPGSRCALERLAAQQGLGKDEVILTGYVPDDDLVALYNLCTLFVFPSWHEGFGLPALEAMRCGAPVIGANTSSLPEVIDWEEALFDPYSDKAISAAIERVLTDPSHRQALINHGKAQAQKFSWDESARRTIGAMKHLYVKRHEISANPPLVRRPKLAYVSPLPPERSGIADYSAELLPELAQFYEIDVIATQDSISDSWIRENCPIRDIQWFSEHSDGYNRVLYHFGNSIFHQHMFSLLKTAPGVIVLHDFFLSGIAAHMDVHRHWSQELYKSHGYVALRDRFHSRSIEDVIWKYPCNLSVIQDSLGMIVHSPNSIRLVNEWYGGDTSDWAVVPLSRSPNVYTDKAHARQALNYSSQDFLVCAFGILGPHKLNHCLLKAWVSSRLSGDNSCHLIFVGENHSGDYGKELLETIRSSGLAGQIHITGWTDPETFKLHLAAADIGVQLRTLSRGETSAAVLDCMNYGLATIVNTNGSMADLPDKAVWKLPDEFTDEQLIEALENLWQHPEHRHNLGKKAREVVLRQHSPQSCAERYGDAIERFYRKADSGLPGLYNAIAQIHGQPDDRDLIQLADAMAKNSPPRNRQRQLLVDISELVQKDVKTGIQRVVRSVLSEWLTNPPKGYRIEPVYATKSDGYCYARNFTLGFLSCLQNWLPDEPIDYGPGDIFFGLDLQPQVQVAQRDFYQVLRRQGVQVRFMVYDLLCVSIPQHFPEGADAAFANWIDVVGESDGAVCISQSVANELSEWVKHRGHDCQRTFVIDWFHLGADVDNSHPTMGIPQDAETPLSQLCVRPSFLMVGTLEPRKGHAQVLDAFEHLWRSGRDINLIIVGKQGWMVDELVSRLRKHPELNKRLFLLEGISDKYLEKVYAASTCLIAASFGEGFGLPLIEAAQHKLPIIVRDIPVFREVAGEHAYYFNGNTPEALAQAIEAWLGLYKSNQHPKSDAMSWLTWKQSAARLMQICIGKQFGIEGAVGRTSRSVRIYNSSSCDSNLGGMKGGDKAENHSLSFGESRSNRMEGSSL